MTKQRKLMIRVFDALCLRVGPPAQSIEKLRDVHHIDFARIIQGAVREERLRIKQDETFAVAAAVYAWLLDFDIQTFSPHFMAGTALAGLMFYERWAVSGYDCHKV